MKPAAMHVTLTMQEPGEGWHYCVLRRGAILADSDGETFPHVGLALKAGIEEAQRELRAVPGKHLHPESGNSVPTLAQRELRAVPGKHDVEDGDL